MKGKKLAAILSVIVVTILVACVAIFSGVGKDKDKDKEPNKNTEQNSEENTEEVETVTLTDEALSGDLLIDFTKGADSSVVFESDGWSNGSVFNVVWTKDNVKYADGKMSLGITKENKNAWLDDKEVTLPYTAGEARTQNYFGYGDYEVKMKPSANPGTASTFFVCTGNYDVKYVLDENGAVVLNDDGTIKTEPNPWDEVDIEFLGKDTTKVQFNFFVNGVGGNEYMYDLGFDAAVEYHEYGFRWEEDSITWFVDDKPVYKVTTDKTATEADCVRIVDVIPSTPGRLLMNYWCGNEDAEGWMGKYEGNVKDNGCEYLWLQTSTKGAPLNPDNIDLSAAENCLVINGQNYLFEGADYTIKAQNDNKALNVTYQNIEGATYKNIATGLTELSSKYNKLTMNVKNNGKKAVKLRIDVQSQTQVSKNTKACNVYATQDGNEVYTDTDWGGSQFEIEAGKTSTLEIYFDASKKTEALIIYIDSADYLEDGKGIMHSGDITFSNVAFGTGKVPVASTPEVPDVDVDTSDLDRVVADLTYESNDIYTVVKDEENKTWNVTYTAAPGESYRTISSAVAAIDAGLNRYTVKVKNNGTEEVKVRIDIIGKTAMGTCPDGNPLKACNLASLQDGEAIDSTDLTWGGSTFTIAAGQTSVLEVVFDASKVVDKVEFFFDTHIYQDGGNTHAGDVTLSEMAFLGELEGEVDGPIVSPGAGNEGDEGGEGTTPEQPETPVSGDLTTTINGTEVTIAGNVTDGYGVNADDDNNTVNVTYTNIVGNSYKNIWANVASIAADKDTFSVKITNNGDQDVTVRIDIESSTTAGTNNIIACNQSATQDGNSVFTDLEWGGSTFVIGAGKTVTAEVLYDTDRGPTNLKIYVDSSVYNDSTTHAGKVTFSEMIFKGGNGTTEPDDGGAGDEGSDSGNTGNEGTETTPDLSTTINGTEVTFDGNIGTSYNVNADDTKDTLNVTYKDLVGGKYENIWADVSAIAKDRDTFKVEITNNGTADVKVRIDIESETKTNNTYACNVSATQCGNEVYTDTTWGGSLFTVIGNSSITVEVKYDPAKKPTNVKFFMDSHTDGDTASYEGNITFAEMKFIDSSKVLVANGKELEFVAYEYDVKADAKNETLNVTYNNMVGNSYKNIEADIREILGDANRCTLKVKNNGTSAVKIRVDIETITNVNENHKVCNVSATQDGADVNTDKEWGGSMFEIAAGETSTLEILFDATKDVRAIKIFIDSHTYQDTNTYTGDVTFSEMEFDRVESLSFWVGEGATGYKVTPQDTVTSSVDVTYKGQDQDFKTMGTWAKDFFADNNTFSIKIKNNKEDAVKIRFDVQGDSGLCATAASGNDSVYTSNGETYITIEGKQEETLVITYTEGAANEIIMFVGCCGPLNNDWNVKNDVNVDVTLSEFKFYTVEAE